VQRLDRTIVELQPECIEVPRRWIVGIQLLCDGELIAAGGVTQVRHVGPAQVGAQQAVVGIVGNRGLDLSRALPDLSLLDLCQPEPQQRQRIPALVLERPPERGFA